MNLEGVSIQELAIFLDLITLNKCNTPFILLNMLLLQSSIVDKHGTLRLVKIQVSIGGCLFKLVVRYLLDGIFVYITQKTVVALGTAATLRRGNGTK